jgi:hypothetical protein
MNAKDAIQHLRQFYTVDRFNFDLNVSMVIAGDSKKKLRQAIVKELTGEDKPLRECSMYAVSDLLKASYEQLQLF